MPAAVVALKESANGPLLCVSELQQSVVTRRGWISPFPSSFFLFSLVLSLGGLVRAVALSDYGFMATRASHAAIASAPLRAHCSRRTIAAAAADGWNN